jgi:hypothetical protein
MAERDYFEDRIKLHRLYFEARQQQTGYFEKLALLNGATVSLVITAALGKFSGTLKHKYTLGVALTSLVLAMLVLLLRNHLSMRMEFYEAGEISNPSVYSTKEVKQQEAKLQEKISQSQTVGVSLSALGIFLLLVEVWLVLVS